MDNPVIGGYEPARIALRRALSMASNVEQEIRLERKGQAVPAQSGLMPNTMGYDPKAYKGDGYDPARARALLDLYGYVDRDGDGWREQPDGSPLVIEISTQPDQASRRLDELQRKDFGAIGIKTEFKQAKWPENLKSVRSGKYMVWRVGQSAAAPDGQPSFDMGATIHKGGQNLARFSNKEFDRAVRAHAGDSRRARTRTAVLRGQAPAGRVRALSHGRAPHPHRPRVAVARRLSTTALLAVVVGVRRHRRGRAGKSDQMKLRTWCSAAAALAAMLAFGGTQAQTTSAAPPAEPAKKVFRYAFNSAETGFDPAQLSDLYSRTIDRNIFDAPLTYDYLARPAKVIPDVAAAMPEVTDDFRTFTIPLRPGIYFQDDPAFKGQTRELVAQDFVYAWKRIFDPRWKSPSYAYADDLRDSRY